MMKCRLLLFTGLVSLISNLTANGSQQSTTTRETSSTTTTAESTAIPDNSGINERDRKADELTAGQQSWSKSDVELTRQIRKRITKNHKLSTNAHNVKIITQNGVVTLKGPVGSQGEMKTIHKIACQVAGEQNVKNEMQVASGE